MRELILRLKLHPLISAELLLSSLFANLLALASSVYVIQVLNRYISYGVDATLVALTTGVCIAILLEFLFRRLRLSLAERVGVERNRQLREGAYGVMRTAKLSLLRQLPSTSRRELMRGLDTIESTYAATNLAALLDVPFALLFVLVLGLISPALGLVAFGFLLVVFVSGLLAQRNLQKHRLQLTQFTRAESALIDTVDQASDTVRLFDNNQHTANAWAANTEQLLRQKTTIDKRQGMLQSVTQSTQTLMTVFIYAIGASLVVSHQLDVGSLIGCSILASRALAPISRFARLTELFVSAGLAMERLRQLGALDVQQPGGTALEKFAGNLALKSLAFSHPGSAHPLFQSLNLQLEQGAVMVVKGSSGSGKTTLAELLLGLKAPDQGQVLVDDVDLRQVASDWWRQQVAYLPQRPTFLNGSIRENLLAANPALDSAGINAAIAGAGLSEFLAQSADGLEMQLTSQGGNLPLKQRKLLALARAIAVGGQLVIMDEPTDGLDPQSKKIIYRLLLKLSRQGRTLVLLTQEPQLVQGAGLVLDLDTGAVTAEAPRARAAAV